MDTSVLNALDFGLSEGEGRGRENTTALRSAIEEVKAAGLACIIIPEGTYEIDGTVTIAMGASSENGSTLRIAGAGHANLRQTGVEAIFAAADTTTSDGFGDVVFENLHFEGNLGEIRDSTLENVEAVGANEQWL